MKKKGDGSFAHNVLTALAIMNDANFFPYGVELPDGQDKIIEFEVFMRSRQLNPEESAILKQAFENLSSDAKEALLIIMFWPDEIIESLGPVNLRGRYSVRVRYEKLIRIFGEMGFEVEKVLSDLWYFTRTYVSVLRV